MNVGAGAIARAFPKLQPQRTQRNTEEIKKGFSSVLSVASVVVISQGAGESAPASTFDFSPREFCQHLNQHRMRRSHFP